MDFVKFLEKASDNKKKSKEKTIFRTIQGGGRKGGENLDPERGGARVTLICFKGGVTKQTGGGLHKVVTRHRNRPTFFWGGERVQSRGKKSEASRVI